jgi:hypothetical protein
MEVIKYLCEFFFCNFWHYMGLLIMIYVVSGISLVSIGNRFTEINHKNNKED